MPAANIALAIAELKCFSSTFCSLLGYCSGLKILYCAMDLNLNYLFLPDFVIQAGVYCAFVPTENSLNAQPSPMRKRKS